VITTLGVFDFDAVSREMRLHRVHPGVTPSSIQAQTGWPLRLAPDLAETEPPGAAELAVIRRFDPRGFWTGARS
jgi:glutaconate CoA-transferase subunit B